MKTNAMHGVSQILKGILNHMAIPIDPAIIANAQLFSSPKVATPIATCSAPVGGAKCVPMQFPLQMAAPNNQTVWKVDLNSGTAIPPISQLSAMYISNSASNAISVIFPDTGYQIDVNPGTSGIWPVITQGSNNGQIQLLPIFYVLINGTSSASNTVVNIIALNQFIPEYELAPIVNQNVNVINPITGESLNYNSTQFFTFAVSPSAGFPDSFSTTNHIAISNFKAQGIIQTTLPAAAVRTLLVTHTSSQWATSHSLLLNTGLNVITAFDITIPNSFFITDSGLFEFSLNNYTDLTSVLFYASLNYGNQS